MTVPNAELIIDLRTASRQLVRELGFLKPTIAGTQLSASSVHAIVEIGLGEGISAKDLGEILLLEKSTISRMIKTFVSGGVVLETPGEKDRRVKLLSLSSAGEIVLAKIVEFAENQVISAMRSLSSTEQNTTLKGIQIYAAALRNSRLSVDVASPKDVTKIHSGYAPGLIGRVATLHANHYSRTVGFAAKFETYVAGGMAEFIPRVENPDNEIWYVTKSNKISGSIAIDGEGLGGNIAQLRCFIIDEGLRGTGLGRRFMQKAIAFCDERQFDEIHLWTFKGLDAARSLYEAFGFSLKGEHDGNQWENKVIEQKFVRKRT